VPHVKEAILAMDGVDHQGDTLYATRCSAHNANCVTAYTSAEEALKGEGSKVTGGMVSGCIAGALIGLLLSLIYQRNHSLCQQLHRAIRRNEVRVHYQPIVDIEDGRIVGAEALARWTDDHDQVIGPDVFVAIAEERGFVGELTRLVVRRALVDFAFTLRGRPDFRLNINVAAADLNDDSFLPMLQEALLQAQVPAQSLAIEITESATARKLKAAGTITELSRRGHSVHVDDFGTGYSSLAYLSELSVDTIKIDRAFTQAIGTGSVTVCILPQILEMADVLNLQVIVEGVETNEQAGYFAAGGRPVLAQGWLFGHPVPADEFHRILAACNTQEPDSIAVA
jgi:sensor c-di-GMP phosphodiesterase-like protein